LFFDQLKTRNSKQTDRRTNEQTHYQFGRRARREGRSGQRGELLEGNNMIKVPRVLPGFIEVEADRYKPSEKATVAEWRAAKAFLRSAGDRRIIFKMVRIAEQLNIPDDVVLLPRLKALAESTPFVG
jgi:hypothetical protein